MKILAWLLYIFTNILTLGSALFFYIGYNLTTPLSTWEVTAKYSFHWYSLLFWAVVLFTTFLGHLIWNGSFLIQKRFQRATKTSLATLGLLVVINILSRLV